MMEFVLSRVWMAIAGVALTAVILAAFGGLNESIADHDRTEGAETLAAIVDDLEGEDASVEMRVEIDRMLPDREGSLTILPGSIWVEDHGRDRAVVCSPGIALYQAGERVDALHLTAGDMLVIRSSGGQVQLEKVSTR